MKTRRLATWEDVAAYELRNAQHRKPQELHESRLVTRASGPVEVRGATPSAHASARRATRELLENARPAIDRCLVANTARDPKVIVRAPAALVLEQGADVRGINHRYSVSLQVENGWFAVDGLDWKDGHADELAGECIRAALHDELRPLASDVSLEIRFDLVSFLDRAEGFNLGLPHRRLAMEAAILGGLELNRGQDDEALAYFEDAYWLFHLPEFKALEGQALERLGRPRKAAAAYLVYLEAREDAPDAPEFSRRAAQLRQAAQ